MRGGMRLALASAALLALLATPSPARAAVFSVTSTDDADDGSCDATHCSLREAINAANNAAGADQIHFNIPGAGPFKIMPASNLPEITGPVVIDGYSQPGTSGNTASVGSNAVLLIELDGTLVAAPLLPDVPTHILRLSGGSSTVRGLVINRYSQEAGAIRLTGAGGNLIVGNFIGTDAAGIDALPYVGGHVLVESSNNTVGGTTLAARNIIHGAVALFGSDASGNVIRGNYIGATSAGETSFNTTSGVGVHSGAHDNTVGGTEPGARNVIAGEVGISGTATTGNLVQGNYLGLKPGGDASFGRAAVGVRISSRAHGNTIGGTSLGARNVISGNSSGVVIEDVGSNGNLIQGNYIGTNAAGTAAVRNLQFGVSISDAANTVVGGMDPGAGNVISGNGQANCFCSALLIQRGASATVVKGNYIGTDATGTTAVPNMGGVEIRDGADGTVIGGAESGARNVISGNGGGISVSQGLGLLGPPSNTVVQGNYIGTNAAGTAAVGNAEGIGIGLAANTLIGGTESGTRNVISGNTGIGLILGVSNGNGVAVQGNYIGTNAAGTTAMPNTVGIWVVGQDHVIGGTTPEARNLISGNSAFGVQFKNDTAVGSALRGNFIGTNAAGTAGLGNLLAGVIFESSAHDNVVGGTSPGEGNTIAFNGGPGVRVDASSQDNGILGNAIFSNAGLGIDLLQPSGVTPNDPGDGDSGGNRLQNFPILFSAVSGSGTTFQGKLDSAPSTTFRLEFFATPTCDKKEPGEGKELLGATNVMTDPSGSASFIAAVAKQVGAGQFVTATATDPDNNTSEFSACIEATGATLGKVDLSIVMSDAPDPVGLKSRLAYEFSLANTGPDTATNVTVSLPLPVGTKLIKPGKGQPFTSHRCARVKSKIVGTGLACNVGSMQPGAAGNQSGRIVLLTPKKLPAGSSSLILELRGSVLADQFDDNPGNNLTPLLKTTVQR